MPINCFSFDQLIAHSYRVTISNDDLHNELSIRPITINLPETHFNHPPTQQQQFILPLQIKTRFSLIVHPVAVNRISTPFIHCCVLTWSLLFQSLAIHCTQRRFRIFPEFSNPSHNQYLSTNAAIAPPFRCNK